MSSTPVQNAQTTPPVTYTPLLQLQSALDIQIGRIDSVANEINELRIEKRVSGDIQEQVIKIQEQIEDIQKIYLKKIDSLEQEAKNVKLYVMQFVRDMEKQYPVDLEDS